MLNQLHIKSNGCFLYLEKVLDGISENFIVLREIREIPGTLNGLYLWMCQRLFTKKQFSKVQCILSVLLASKKPLREDEIFLTLEIHNSGLTKDDFKRRMQVLRRVIVKTPDKYIVLFHHSFSEWLVDVKYCTQKYLCHVAEGHFLLAVLFAHLATHCNEQRTADLCYHIKAISHPYMDPDFLTPFLLSLPISPSCTRLVLSSLSEKSLAGLDHSTVRVETSIHENLNSHPPQAETNETDTFFYLDEGAGEALCDSTEDSYAASALTDESRPVRSSWSRNYLSELSNLDRESYSKLLHIAANEGNVEMLEFLILHSVDIDGMDRHGKTALNIAAQLVIYILMGCRL